MEAETGTGTGTGTGGGGIAGEAGDGVSFRMGVGAAASFRGFEKTKAEREAPAAADVAAIMAIVVLDILYGSARQTRRDQCSRDALKQFGDDSA